MSANLEKDLRDETVKWLKRADELLQIIVPGEEKSRAERFLENISAYIFDSRYFLEYGDLIRAFEAVVWAWSWLEIGLEMGILRKDLTGCIQEEVLYGKDI
jgi:hypothetical protein